jgi:hypothetical protein
MNKEDLEFLEDNKYDIDGIAKKLGFTGNLDQLKRGIKVEFEHKDIIGDDVEKSAKIAIAHLKEMPDYYTKLKKMESGFNDLPEGGSFIDNG